MRSIYGFTAGYTVGILCYLIAAHTWKIVQTIQPIQLYIQGIPCVKPRIDFELNALPSGFEYLNYTPGILLDNHFLNLTWKKYPEYTLPPPKLRQIV